ncbi:MAG: hypothetical protein M1819_001306 [Sarea resinae]|nr:MAG: hypothetical protein M1819_001306 [Sarea resinae]
MKSNLDLVEECDSFPYQHSNPTAYASYYLFKVRGCNSPLGYILASTADNFQGFPGWEVDHNTHVLTLVHGSTAQERSKVVARTAETLRQMDKFQILRGWRNELFPVYGMMGELLFDVERAASPLLGIVSYGVHMTAYVRSGQTLKVWVPRRAKTKQTYGGMLDNTVAGGMSTGEQPFETLVREASEEASLSEALVRRDAKPCGTVSYFHVRGERAGGETGLLQPECQYVYDLQVEEGIRPRPGDNEVEDFYLLSVDQIKAALKQGEFKPNCALVLLDFFIRHGILTPENEKDYIEIVARIHRRLEFPTC